MEVGILMRFGPPNSPPAYFLRRISVVTTIITFMRKYDPIKDNLNKIKWKKLLIKVKQIEGKFNLRLRIYIKVSAVSGTVN